MNQRELCEMIRERRGRVLPLVGAGLALDAGAPSASDVAVELVRRFDLGDLSLDLDAAARAAEAATDRLTMQIAVAEIVARTRPRSTAALTALVSGPVQTVLTTNYDDAIEQAVRARGGSPITLRATDQGILDPPAVDEVHVIHLHGLTNDPSSIILPGEQMERLAESELFQRLLTGAVIPRHLLYLGFAFGKSEVHLRTLVRWLAEEISGPRTHWLPLGARQIRNRRNDLDFFAKLGNVEVVAYDDSAGHKAVVSFALALAPRGYDRADDPRVDERITWVAPALVVQNAGETREDLERRMWTFDFSGAPEADIRDAEALGTLDRSVVVAAPGMGKTKLVQWLPYKLGRPCSVGQFRYFRPADPHELDRGILRLLTNSSNNQPISLDEWLGEQLTIVVDGLDELDHNLHAAALESLKKMASTVPQHRVIVTTRPIQAVDKLIDLGFEILHILPSRRWAEKYLETRALTKDLISRALAVNTLGDLAVIPLFSEVLADRLLDSMQPIPDALTLLVNSQVQAIAREATRAEVQRAPLEVWVRRLALGLQLRGRPSIPIADLSPSKGSVGPDVTVDRLRRASVLGDRPDEASFARRTFQEALVADSILTHRDPVTAFEWAAVTSINGRKTIRRDFDFVADLVFEHATRADRETLRELDPERWARTVALRGTVQDGRRAFKWIETWHQQHGISYLSFLDRNLLRSLESAARSICQRWPEIVRRRKKRLVRDLAVGAPDARARALTALGTLPKDAETESWLLPCLSDSSEHIVATAASLVSQHELTAASPQLIDHLKSSSALVRRAALRALIDVLPGDRLTEVGPHLSIQDPPGPIAEELAEMLNLDDALNFLASLHTRSHTCTWLLDRVIATTPTHAWTNQRIRTLMAALAVNGLQREPDYAALAGVVELHLSTALTSVRPSLLAVQPQRWYLPEGQAEALLAVDDAALAAAHPSSEIQHALDAARDDREERQLRQHRHEDAQVRLEAMIDADGDLVDLVSIRGVGRLDLLDAQRRATLTRAIDRAWPVAALAAATSYISDPAIDVGGEITAPISVDHWRQLLEAHLRATGWHGIGGTGITHWLVSTRRDEVISELIERISACDVEQIDRLLIISGAENPAVAKTAHRRLLQLSPDARGWLSAAQRLLGSAETVDVAALLGHAGTARSQLIGELARRGDPVARTEVLARMTEEVARGQDPEPPTWPNATYDASFAPLLSKLAASAGTESKSLSFAITALTQITDSTSVAFLERLAADRGIWWIELAAAQAAGHLATSLVLSRLDDDTLAAARAFFAL